MKFFVYDSDGNQVMSDKGYGTLAEAVDAASALALYIWPDVEIGKIQNEADVLCAEFVAVSAVPALAKFPQVTAFSDGVRIEGRGALLNPRTVRVTYSPQGLAWLGSGTEYLVPGRELPVFTVAKRRAGTARVPVGRAEVAPDGSIFVVLDTLPVNGTLTIGGAS